MNNTYAVGHADRQGFLDDLNQFKPLGLFDAKIVSRSDEKNNKGRYFYYITFDVNYSANQKKTKKCLVTSEYLFEPGQIVAVDLINWRDQNSKQYSLFLTLIPPVGTEVPNPAA